MKVIFHNTNLRITNNKDELRIGWSENAQEQEIQKPIKVGKIFKSPKPVFSIDTAIIDGEEN
jgi:hypothetical protein